MRADAESGPRRRPCGLQSGPARGGRHAGVLRGGCSGCGDRALDEATAENARLAVGRIVEHAGLAWRHSVLARKEIDLDALACPAQPRRLRRSRGADLDEHLLPAGAQGLVDASLAQPIDVAQPHPAGAQRRARPDHDPARRGVKPDHIKRMARGDAEPAPLADGEMDDAGMRAENAAVEIDDVAGLGRPRLEALDHLGVAARRYEADVLAVVLVGHRERKLTRKFARLRLSPVSERKAQQVELLASGGKQEIALVALLFAGAVERAAATWQGPGSDVMAGRQDLGAEFARGRKQIAELDRLVAFDAGHRRFAGNIALGEAIDHHLLEATLVIQYVVGNADALRHRTRVVDVLAGATGAFAMGRGTVVVELQRHAHDVVALGLEQRRRPRGVYPARHGHNHASVLRPAIDIETIEH